MSAPEDRRPRPADSGTTIGVFVFEETWRGWDRRETADACRRLADCGVNRFMTETWNLDHELVDTAHEHGMVFWTSVACYSDHGSPAWDTRPELVPITESGEERPRMEWYVGLVPTDPAYNERLAERCASIAATFEIDGLCLDFMRWPLHWEIELRDGAVPVESSFDAGTMSAYREVNGALPQGKLGAEAAAWILEHDRSGWVEFKCAVIEESSRRIVAAIRSERPQLPTGLFVVPCDHETRRRTVGQDLTALEALFDELLPMAYHRILRRDPPWVAATVSEARSLAPSATVLPVVQLSSEPQFAGGADWGAAMAPGEHEMIVAAALESSGGAGVVAFPGEGVLAGTATTEIRQALGLSRAMERTSRER